MNKFYVFIILCCLPVVTIGCSRMDSLKDSLLSSFEENELTSGQIGFQLPYEIDSQNNSEIEPDSCLFKVSVDGITVDYSQKLTGFCGEVLMLEEIPSGKYMLSYEVFDGDNERIIYCDEQKISVYNGIFTPVQLELVAVE